METNTEPRLNSLFDWTTKLLIATFSNNYEITTPTIEHFQDGILLGKILKDIIDPEYFSDVNYDLDSEFTTLIEIRNKMVKYIQVKSGHLISSDLLPKTEKILSSGDPAEIVFLVQLLVTCAVHCPDRKIYYDDILELLDPAAMATIRACVAEMTAIKLDQGQDQDQNGSKNFHDTTIQSLSQENWELKLKMAQMTSENEVLYSENRHLQESMKYFGNKNEFTVKENELRGRIDRLRLENSELANLVDEYDIKQKNLEIQLNEALRKSVSNSKAAQDLIDAKEEIVSLRGNAGKLAKMESMAKRLSDVLGDAECYKNSNIRLQQQNEELTKETLSLKADLANIDVLKRQIAGLQNELVEHGRLLELESKRASTAELEQQRVYEKFENSILNIRKLQDDKYRLEEKIQEVQDEAETERDNGLFELTLKIEKLEAERKALQQKLNERNGSSRQNGEPDVEQAHLILVEQLRKRETELYEQLCKKDADILKMKNYYENELVAGIKRPEKVPGGSPNGTSKHQKLYANPLSGSVENIPVEGDDLRGESSVHKPFIATRSEILISTPTTSPVYSLPQTPDGYSDRDPTSFRKNYWVIDPQEEIDKIKNVYELEEKLMSTAFYNYGLTLHRHAVDERNSTLLESQRKADITQNGSGPSPGPGRSTAGPRYANPKPVRVWL